MYPGRKGVTSRGVIAADAIRPGRRAWPELHGARRIRIPKGADSMSGANTLSQDLSRAISSCRQQQEAWASLPVRQRLRPVRAFRRLLVREGDRLSRTVVTDMGKRFEEALGEVLGLAEACRFLECEAGRLLRPRPVPRRHRPLWLWGQHDTVYRQPRGVVGIIGTWNFPILLNGTQILQALAAGNGVAWKPSELAAGSAAMLFGLLEEAGFPKHLVHLLEPTREAGRDLAESDVDHVVFTGSDATGRQLASRLGQRLVSSTLELSGCDAMFVMEDADVPLAAKAAWFGSTLNRGQTCLAVRRAFVHYSIYGAFIDALRPLAAAALPVSLAMASQVQQAEELVALALADGARLLEGSQPVALTRQSGEGRPGNLCPVRVVLDAPPDTAVCTQATFAPLMAVFPFDTVEEALRLNALCPFGLGASVFTRDVAGAARLAARLRVGVVTVNDVVVPTAHPATPLGGRGASGWGVTQGAEGLLEMTMPQVVSLCGSHYRPHYEPVGTTWMSRAEALRGLLEWGHGATICLRLGGLWRLLRAPRTPE